MFQGAPLYTTFTFFFWLYFPFFSWHCETASLENKWSLRSVIFSSMNNIRSDKLGFIVLFLLMLKNLLFHLCSNTPVNLDSNKHMMSGLSRRFQLSLSVTFWHQTKTLLNFLKPAASPNFSCCHSFISILYDPSSRWGSPYHFSNSILEIWYPSLGCCWIQLITSSFASPLVYLISLMRRPRGSSSLFSTTS